MRKLKLCVSRLVSEMVCVLRQYTLFFLNCRLFCCVVQSKTMLHNTYGRINVYFIFQVTLLDPKKSMNVNIFLKQFRKPNDVIIELIKSGEARSLGVEKLKGLLKLIPSQDEVSDHNTDNFILNTVMFC